MKWRGVGLGLDCRVLVAPWFLDDDDVDEIVKKVRAAWFVV